MSLSIVSTTDILCYEVMSLYGGPEEVKALCGNSEVNTLSLDETLCSLFIGLGRRTLYSCSIRIMQHLYRIDSSYEYNYGTMNNINIISKP